MLKNKGVYLSILNQGWVRPELASLIPRLQEQRKYNLFVAYPAHKPITHNRNTIVRRFLQTDLDYLLMIDSDNVPPDNILDMADYQKDIIAGMCFAYMDNTLIPLCLKKNEHERYDIADVGINQGIVECDGVGSGVMMIKREVLENMPFPFRNDYDPEGIKTRGLDVNFCRRAKEKGYKVWCDTNMPCSHWTNIDLCEVYKTYSELKRYILLQNKELDDKPKISTIKKDN